jgi:hypothetical protein
VPLHFSPIDQSELANPYTPRPRGAFLMLRLGKGASQAEMEMAAAAREVLSSMCFQPVTAADIRGTGDYLGKIVDLIRGCGFGIAIYCDQTPARTMGNIFFEVGVCGVLGKPVQLVLSGQQATPSDFVRTEWLEYKAGQKLKLRRALRESFDRIEQLADFYGTLGQLAMEAQVADLELAFERFKPVILIAEGPEPRASIIEIRRRLEKTPRKRSPIRDDMASHRMRLLKAVSEFLASLPPPCEAEIQKQ